MAEKLTVPEFQESAYIYAVYRTYIDFGLYDKTEINTNHLLELHIFNNEMEYRAIFSTVKKTFIEQTILNDITDHFIDDKMMLYGTEMERIDKNQVARTQNGRKQIFRLSDIVPKTVFGNSSKVINKKLSENDCLYVRNYYSFDKNDLLYLSGYRLLGITEGENKIGKKE